MLSSKLPPAQGPDHFLPLVGGFGRSCPDAAAEASKRGHEAETQGGKCRNTVETVVAIASPISWRDGTEQRA